MRLRRLVAKRWAVLAVCSERGDCDLADFLTGLEGNLAPQARRVWALLDLVAEDGPPRNTDISHDVGPGIWEFIRDDLRVLWFYDEKRVVVCSHGFVKKSQRTPRNQIELAESAKSRYFAAKRAGRLLIEEYEDEADE